MIYASTPPRNTDPTPYFGLSDERFSVPPSRVELALSEGLTYAPRPEFDQPRAHEANPVLVKFRQLPEASRAPWLRGFVAAVDRYRFANWTDDQAHHARRVLTRLANFTEDAS